MNPWWWPLIVAVGIGIFYLYYKLRMSTAKDWRDANAEEDRIARETRKSWSRKFKSD